MGERRWRSATLSACLLAGIVAAGAPIPAAAESVQPRPSHSPAQVHPPAPTPAASHHQAPTPAPAQREESEAPRQPVPVPVQPRPVPQRQPTPTPVTVQRTPQPSGHPTPRPAPLPTRRPHPEPSHQVDQGHRGRTTGTGQTQGTTPAPAWSSDGWLAFVQLSSARDRERNLKDEREALSAYVQSALAQQAESNRQADAATGQEQQLGAASMAAQFRARNLEVQLAGLGVATEQMRQPMSFLELLGHHPDQLLIAITQPGGLRRVLSGLSSLSGSQAGRLSLDRLTQRKTVLTAVGARLKADQVLLSDTTAAAGIGLLTAREAKTGQVAQSQRLGVTIAQSQADLAELNARVEAAIQQTWEAAAQLQDPQFATLSANHSTQYRFVWPESNAWISQGFGPSSLWGEPAFMGFAHFHQGVDLAAPANSLVVAADDGVVIMTQSGNYGYGNFVMVAHPGGVTTLYGHLNRILVRTGDQLMQGQPVGLEGSTGYSTGPHLHFEVRVDGEPVDPMPFLPYGSPSTYRR